MGTNLTIEKKIVSNERQGYISKPGHSLVVYENIPKFGKKLSRIVPEGEMFTPRKKKIFEQEPEYLSYWVNMDTNLSVYFSPNNHSHKSGGHEFGLGFKIYFSVSDAEKLVNRLDDDPIKKIRDLIESAIALEIAKVSWVQLCESKVKDDCGDLFNKIIGPNKDKFDDFAEQYGIKLKEVIAALFFGTTDSEVFKKAAEEEKAQLIAKINHETEKHKIHLENEINALNIKMEHASEEERLNWLLQISHKKHELDCLNSWHENDRNEIKRIDKHRDVIFEGKATIVGNLADEIRSPEAVVNLYEKIEPLFQKTGMGVLDKRSLEAGQSSTGLIGVIPSTVRFGLLATLQEAVEQLGTEQDKGIAMKRLLSYCLHLLAELSLGNKCDLEIVSDYQDKIRKNLDPKVNEDVTVSQIDYLHRIFDDLEVLKQRLA